MAEYEIKNFNLVNDPAGRTFATAQLLIDGEFSVNSIQLKRNVLGQFYVRFPIRVYTEKDGNANVVDVACPIEQRVRQIITDKMIDNYYETKGLERPKNIERNGGLK